VHFKNLDSEFKMISIIDISRIASLHRILFVFWIVN